MTIDTDSTGERVPLYRHTKRTEWGLAILAWEEGDRRGYQFEDGQLRTFKEGFYSLLEEVDRPSDQAAATVATLSRQLGVAQARKAIVEQAADSGKRVITLEDQIKVFNIEYPGGFADPAWLEARGVDVKRRLKKHREPAIEAAAEHFSRESLDSYVNAGRFADLHGRILEVLGTTTLVPPARLKQLQELDESTYEALGRSLRDLLWNDDEPYEMRFERFLTAVGSEPSWTLSTSPAALLRPSEHICVRPSSFRKQAMWMAPRLNFVGTPSAKQYVRLLQMSRSIESKLKDAGLEPRDLMDIHDFIRQTLRPAAIKLLSS